MEPPAVIHRARRVVTLDPAFPSAEAVAVRGDRILGVGSVAEMTSAWGAGAVDDTFADAVLFPGFVEAHSHSLEGALWAWEYTGYFPRLGPDGELRRDQTLNPNLDGACLLQLVRDRGVGRNTDTRDGQVRLR